MARAAASDNYLDLQAAIIDIERAVNLLQNHIDKKSDQNKKPDSQNLQHLALWFFVQGDLFRETHDSENAVKSLNEAIEIMSALGGRGEMINGESLPRAYKSRGEALAEIQKTAWAR